MTTRTENKNIDKKTTPSQHADRLSCQIQPKVSLQYNAICPRCRAGRIDYDGLLNLVCPNCGLTEMGANT